MRTRRRASSGVLFSASSTYTTDSCNHLLNTTTMTAALCYGAPGSLFRAPQANRHASFVLAIAHNQAAFKPWRAGWLLTRSSPTPHVHRLASCGSSGRPRYYESGTIHQWSR
ncbi:hypothetical protein PG988_006581 [Apiospora saccharicola]